MRKYSKDVVISYINGFDVPYDIEELENDYLFMMDVLDYTNDKNMYNMCSSSVKRNYEFVKFFILKFKDDVDFICNVFDYYYKNSSNELEKIDLLIILVNLLEKKDIEKFIKYKLCLLAFYTEYKVVLDKIKMDDYNDELNVELGFFVIFDDYCSNCNVTSYFASNLINDIFDDNGFTLEDVLHSEFNNFSDFEKKGVNSFLINFIGRYDKLLRDYVITHLYLLDGLKGKLEYIKNNWDNYNEEKRKLRYEVLYDRVSDYIYDRNYIFNEFDILCVLAREYGMEEEFANYFDIKEEFEGIILTSSFTNIDKDDLRTLVIYNDIKRIFCEVMFSKKLVLKDNYIIEDKKNLGIVRFREIKKLNE